MACPAAGVSDLIHVLPSRTDVVKSMGAPPPLFEINSGCSTTPGAAERVPKRSRDGATSSAGAPAVMSRLTITNTGAALPIPTWTRALYVPTSSPPGFARTATSPGVMPPVESTDSHAGTGPLGVNPVGIAVNADVPDRLLTVKFCGPGRGPPIIAEKLSAAGETSPPSSANL